MNKRKILILGIGNAQMDLIKWCKDRGWEVHACSYTKTGRGKNYVDHFELIDIKDADKTLQYVQAYGPDLIYSIGSDVAMPTIAYVAEHAGLYSFVNHHTAGICQNKAALRAMLGADFPYNVPFLKGTDPTDLVDWNIYPAIIKPVDSQGQRGIYKVNSWEDVEAGFHRSVSFSSSREVIIEKYLEGDEISINAYMVENEVRFFYLSDRISYHEYPGGIIKEHLYPSKYAHLEDSLKTLVSRTANKLDIRNGPLYFQVGMVNEVPHVIEVAPRFDGCHMWRLIKMTKGIDLLEITMSHLLSQSLEPTLFSPLENTDRKTFRLKFLAQPPLSLVDYSSQKVPSEVLYEERYYHEGSTVPKMNGFMEKTGYFIDLIGE